MGAHRLVGGGAQVVVAQLEPGEMVWCQPGAFLWKTPNVQVQTRVIGAGAEAGGGAGLLDRALATAVTAGRRRLAGQAAALPSFTVPAESGRGLVAFAGSRAGEIRALRLEGGRGWLVAAGALVAAEAGVGFALGERSPAGFERLGGSGTAFVCGRGSLLELDLARYGGSLDVDRGRLVAVQDGVQVEPPEPEPHRATPGAGADALLTAVLGGGRPSVARLSGAGLALRGWRWSSRPPRPLRPELRLSAPQGRRRSSRRDGVHGRRRRAVAGSVRRAWSGYCMLSLTLTSRLTSRRMKLMKKEKEDPMALLDDAKAFAEQAQRTLDQAVEQVGGRIDQFNRRRSFNELARQLGMLVYRARSLDQDPDPAEVTRLCGELATVEAELMASGPGPRQGPGSGTSQPGPEPDPEAPTQAQRRDYTLDDL